MSSISSKIGLLASIVAVLFACSLLVPMGQATALTPGTTSGVAPDPALNAQSYAAFSGLYTYTAAGAAMRNSGYGTITVTWTGSLVNAYLVWGVINPTYTGTNQGVFNGHSITGTFQSTDLSPCWGNGNLTVFAADVSSYVLNGANSLTGFASGITTGQDPWSASTAPLDEGASLIVVSTSSTANQIYIYTGTYTTAGGSLTSTFNHGAADLATGQTTFVVADGQLHGNTARFNGVTIDSDAFPGSDPHASTATWSYGSLWDTKTYTVPITIGSTTETAGISGSGDCLTWAAQVISMPTTAPLPPGTGSNPSPPVTAPNRDRDNGEPVGTGNFPYSLVQAYTGSGVVAIVGPGICNTVTGTNHVCLVIPGTWTATLLQAPTAASYWGVSSTSHLHATYSTSISIASIPANATSVWLMVSPGVVSALNSIVSRPQMSYLSFPGGVYADYGWYPV